uniref:Major facilitator superfamily (MFS) profile domain-containing protein n=2 Tax=Castor canadensis TaxID=51338 RepID=A0A8C0WPY0_CASCN
MGFEELLRHVGHNGKFQILSMLILTFLNLLSSPHDFMENFTAAIPAHHCYVHLLDNPKSAANITINLTADALLRVSIPVGPNQKPEQCRRFRQTQWQLLDSNVSAMNNTELETEPCLDGWTYDQSVFTSTIVTEWDLVCDSQSFRYFAQTISMTGYLMGTTVNGIFSDRFGRKPLLVTGCLAYGILGTCCAFAPIFSVYCILRFLMSACISAIQNNTILLLLEGTSSTWHPAVVTVFGLSWSVGQALFAGLAYVFRDWHMLQLALILPYFIISLFICWIPESVRWLITTGKTERALRELQKIAYINGKKDAAESLTTEVLRSKLRKNLNVTSKHFRVKEIIINPTVRKVVLSASILTFSSLFSSYGLLLDIQTLGKDMFLTQFLLGLIDLPSKLLTFFIIRHINRRPSVAFSLLLLGSSILITIFVFEEMHILRLIIILLGKASFSTFTSLFLVFGSELSPTILRSTLQSICIFASRLAATLSALTLVTRRYFIHLPMILYGTFPIVSSICVYFLPETFNLPLPDTIKDMEKRNKSTRENQREDLLETTEV